MVLAGVVGVGWVSTSSVQAVSVGLELALVVDESGSVDNAEWLLQRNGYISAFQNGAVHAAIAGVAGGIAVSYIQFADGVQTGIGWTQLTDATSANAFAASILGLARFGTTGTGVARAIDYAWKQFGDEVGQTANGFESGRQVIDVSGDGANNRNLNGSSSPMPPANLTRDQRDAALAAGIDRINGLVIDPDGEVGLLAFYQNQVQGGVNSFTITADSFSDFEDTVRRKILAEVTDTNPDPVPDSAALIWLTPGLLCLVHWLRQRKLARA